MCGPGLILVHLKLAKTFHLCKKIIINNFLKALQCLAKIFPPLPENTRKAKRNVYLRY
jgi:hypothetical protein